MLLDTALGTGRESLQRCLSDRVRRPVNVGARTLAISLQLLPASRMLFSLLSSAGVHGVFVLPFFTTGDDEGSDDCSPASPVPPESPYADVAAVVVACCIVELELGAFRFLEPVGLLNGVSVFNRLVSWVEAGFGGWEGCSEMGGGAIGDDGLAVRLEGGGGGCGKLEK